MGHHKLKYLMTFGLLTLVLAGSAYATPLPPSPMEGQGSDVKMGSAQFIEEVNLANRRLVIDGNELYLPSSSVVTLLDEWGKPYKAAMRKLEPGMMVEIELRGDDTVQSITEIRFKRVDL